MYASNTGATALEGTGARLVATPEHAGWKGGDACSLSAEGRRALEERGIEVLVCAHALSGGARSISNKLGGGRATWRSLRRRCGGWGRG